MSTKDIGRIKSPLDSLNIIKWRDKGQNLSMRRGALVQPEGGISELGSHVNELSEIGVIVKGGANEL